MREPPPALDGWCSVTTTSSVLTSSSRSWS